MQTALLFICRYPGGAALSVLAIEVCAAPKGNDFEPFLSVTGYRMKPFWGLGWISENGCQWVLQKRV